jgi:hypothetical protein
LTDKKHAKLDQTLNHLEIANKKHPSRRDPKLKIFLKGENDENSQIVCIRAAVSVISERMQ